MKQKDIVLISGQLTFKGVYIDFGGSQLAFGWKLATLKYVANVVCTTLGAYMVVIWTLNTSMVGVQIRLTSHAFHCLFIFVP